MKVKENEKSDQNLPKEWIELVKLAMQSNVTKEEFEEFLREKAKG